MQHEASITMFCLECAEVARKEAEEAMQDQLEEDDDKDPLVHVYTYSIGSMPWKDLADMRKNDPLVWRLENLKHEQTKRFWELAVPLYAKISNTIKDKAGKLEIPAENLNWMLELLFY